MDSLSPMQPVDISELNDLLCDLVNIHEKNVTGSTMKRLLEYICTLSRNRNVNLPPKLFQNLSAALQAGIASNVGSSLAEYRQVLDLLCMSVELQMRKFPSAECKLMLVQLASIRLNDRPVEEIKLPAEIPSEFFNDLNIDPGLERLPQVIRIIQQLLQSKKKQDRQSAVHIMHKLAKLFDTCDAFLNLFACPKDQWTSYIAIVESLEENHDHSLILLDNLKPDPEFSSWMNILYHRLLNSEHIIIVYKTIKYIMGQLKLSHLTKWNVIPEFIAATNRIELYNVEDDHRIYPMYKDFLTNSDMPQIIEAMVNVSWEWQSIAMFEWLDSMPKENENHYHSISKELLFKFAAKVGAVKNPWIKKHAYGRINNIFSYTLTEKLSLEEDMIYVNNLYGEVFGIERLHNKMLDEESLQLRDKYCRLDLLHSFYPSSRKIYDIIDKLHVLPKDQHGLLRYYPLFEIRGPRRIRNFLSLEYGVDPYLVVHGKNLRGICQHLYNTMQCANDEERFIVRKIATDLYFESRIFNWGRIRRYRVDLMEVIDCAGIATLASVGKRLAECMEELEDERIVPALVNVLKERPVKDVAMNIGEYAARNLPIDEQFIIFGNIIHHHVHRNDDLIVGLLTSHIEISTIQILNGILHYMTHNSDAWIEESYAQRLHEFFFSRHIPSVYIMHVLRKNVLFIEEIGDELVRRNYKLTTTHPNYFRNSKEHKQKFCIAAALIHLVEKYECSDHLWAALYSRSEIFNITCMYELIVGLSITDAEVIFDRMNSMTNLTITQQLSSLSVIHIFFRLKWKLLTEDQTQRLTTLLMVKAIDKIDDRVKLFAKMILQRLISAYMTKGVLNFTPEMTSVKQIHARLLLPDIYLILFNSKNQPHRFNSYGFGMSNIKPTYLKPIELKVIEEFRSVITI